MNEDKSFTNGENTSEPQDKKVIDDRDGKGRFVKGNKAAQMHGAYTIKEGGEIPYSDEKEAIEKRLDELRKSLEEQYPKRNLKTELLICDIVRIEATIAHLELYLYKVGSPVDTNRFRKRNIAEVQPCMKEFLQCITMKRHALKELEAEVGGGRGVKTPMEVIAEIEEEETG